MDFFSFSKFEWNEFVQLLQRWSPLLFWREKNVCFALRMHQLLVVDPKWVEEANDSLKQKLMEKMSSAEEVVKKFRRQNEYKLLKQCHPNAWTPSVLGDILSGKTKNTSTGKNIGVQIRQIPKLGFLFHNIFYNIHKQKIYMIVQTFETWLSNSNQIFLLEPKGQISE